MIDPNSASLDKSGTFVENWCAKEIAKDRLTEAESRDVINRITYSNELNALSNADFVIEAANEDFNIKKVIFQGLAKTVPDHAIMATNTSSISISKIGGIVPERAHQVIGMHFMNPVPVMKLVEVITALQTDDATL